MAKFIIVEEDTFNRIFDDFAKDVELAKYETLEFTPADKLAERDALQQAHRRWVYAFRTMQDRLRKER